MTPAEKAKEIYDRFDDLSMEQDIHWATDSAKRCAMLVVNEILQVIPPLIIIQSDNAAKAFSYWQQVKGEINKL